MLKTLKNLNILEIKNVSKSFAGIDALKKVNLEAKYGETLALLGENGAGKSTLVKIIFGAELADSGEIWFDGKLKRYSSPNQAYKDGISVMFQETSLVPQLTVLKNVFLGNEIVNCFGMLDEASMLGKFKKYCKELEVKIDPYILVENLSVANQKLVEIIKALTRESRFIIMDEPTDSLSLIDAERLLNIIQNLKSKNVTILYISHKLKEIFKVADKIIVLRDGQNTFTTAPSKVSVKELITKIVGEPIRSNHIKKNKSSSNFSVLKAYDISAGHTLNKISFEICLGEVLVITGLIGAGKSKLAKILFGLSHFDSGELFLNGDPYKPNRPKDAIKKNVYLMPEDRKNKGLHLDFEIYKNITITNLSNFINFLGLVQSKEISISKRLLSSMNFLGCSPSKIVRKLSGGNQQKVVFSKWLHRQPKLLILDEPTRGMDIKARYEIIDIVRSLAKGGCGVLYLTSDFNEVKHIADRTLLLHEGRLLGEIEPDASIEKIMLQIFNPKVVKSF